MILRPGRYTLDLKGFSSNHCPGGRTSGSVELQPGHRYTVRIPSIWLPCGKIYETVWLEDDDTHEVILGEKWSWR
jgi:hypothetical protein